MESGSTQPTYLKKESVLISSSQFLEIQRDLPPSWCWGKFEPTWWTFNGRRIFKMEDMRVHYIEVIPGIWSPVDEYETRLYFYSQHNGTWAVAHKVPYQVRPHEMTWPAMRSTTSDVCPSLIRHWQYADSTDNLRFKPADVIVHCSVHCQCEECTAKRG